MVHLKANAAQWESQGRKKKKERKATANLGQFAGYLAYDGGNGLG